MNIYFPFGETTGNFTFSSVVKGWFIILNETKARLNYGDREIQYEPDRHRENTYRVPLTTLTSKRSSPQIFESK